MKQKKKMTSKMVEGDLLEFFKIFLISGQVDTSGEDNLVIWTIDYEKVDESVKDPTEYLDLLLCMTKDIETHHLSKE